MGTITEDKMLNIPDTEEEKVLKKLALFFTSIFFIFTGLRHLVVPDFYMMLMPSFLPVPLFLIYFTGALQVIFAVGLLFTKFRKVSAYGLLAFLLATLPVLVYMWVYRDAVPSSNVPGFIKILSIPLQFALIYWVNQLARNPKAY